MKDSYDEELIQVAAVAIAALTDVRYGCTAYVGFIPSPIQEAIERERQRQEDQWGERHLSKFDWLVILGEEFGEACKAALEDA